MSTGHREQQKRVGGICVPVLLSVEFVDFGQVQDDGGFWNFVPTSRLIPFAQAFHYRLSIELRLLYIVSKFFVHGAL